MTLIELKQRLNEFDKNGRDNWKVLIDLDQVSVGTRAYSEISDVYLGFDWEREQIRISPTKSLIDKDKDRDIAIPKRKEPVFGKYVCGACGSFVHKSDKYCCSCGQNIDGFQD